MGIFPSYVKNYTRNMKKMYHFLLATVTMVTVFSMVSCNKSDDNYSNNVPVADPYEVFFKWDGGEKDIAVRPTQGSRMTKDWEFVKADNPSVDTHTTERMNVDTMSTPGVKIISNNWIKLTVTDLGRQIKVKVLRNTTPTARSIRFTGKCEDNSFSFIIRQSGISY